MRKLLIPLAAASMLAGSAFAAEKAALPADQAAPLFKVATPDFAKAATAGGEFEIKSSQLAEQKASNEAIKTFAKQMIADHTKVGEELKATLEKAGTTAPAPMLMPKQAAMIKQLEDANGADFEALYVDMQAAGHMETIALFRNYSGGGDNETVQAFAKAKLPELEGHMMHLKEIIAMQ